MTEFVYIGDDKQPPESVTVYGYSFKLHGAPVDVKERNAVEKLRGNKTFLEIPPAPEAPAESQRPAAPEAPFKGKGKG